MKRFFAISCAAVLFPANVVAEDADQMWAFVMARLCIGQDAGYRETLLGRFVMQGRLAFQSPEFDRCVRDKSWLPHKLCDEVMALDSEEAFSRKNLGRLRNQYASELRAASVAGDYLAAFDKAESQGTAVPACPQGAAGSHR
ncbi:MAG TPA: hypothetical protein VJQ51_11450 [Burkholderiales bacterium]|nr:hypothetical protein [Burkholderiales bacterium]